VDDLNSRAARTRRSAGAATSNARAGGDPPDHGQRGARPDAGAEDGRILRWKKSSATPVEVANTGCRPMGLQVDHTGALIICDAIKGLLRLQDGKPTTLATACDGVPLGFTDDVDAGADGTLDFSNATTRFDVFHHRLDALDHGTSYDPATRSIQQLAAVL